MLLKRPLELVDEFIFLGSESAFEKTFYEQVTKGEVGYNHKGLADLNPGQKRFVGSKTIDEKNNYRLRLNLKASPLMGTQTETYLEITPNKDYLSIKAITRPNEGNLFLLNFFLIFSIFLFIPLWIFLTTLGYWYSIFLMLFLVGLYYINWFVLKESVKQLRTNFVEYFITWEKIQSYKHTLHGT